MRILIAAIGKISNSSIKIMISDYLKRISWEIKFIEHLAQNKNNRSKDLEANLLIASTREYSKIILDEKGIMLDSIEFANLIRRYNFQQNKIAFLIGGAEGHGELVRQKADFSLSLSKMTFPHLMSRLILVEQIYRAYTICNNHPYHKI